jgi:regulator of protease activity HflC (stomatin/prohibitin superfamily)
LQANAEAIASVAHALEQQGGDRAAALKVAEQYVAAFGQIARQGTTVVIPSNLAGLVQGALSVLPKKSADSSQG